MWGHLVTQHYVPEQIGSAFYTHDVARLFDEHGLPLSVLTGQPGYPCGKTFEDTPAHELRDGVRVRRLATHPAASDSAVRRGIAEAEFLVRGAAAFATGRLPRRGPVVAVTPGMSAAMLAQRVRGPGARGVVIVHDVVSGLARTTGLAGGRAARAIERIEAGVLSRFDAVVVLSRQMADALRSIGVTAPVTVVPLWAADDLVESDVPRESGPVAMYSGALGRKQGLTRLADLAAGLRCTVPGAVLAIGGNGPGRVPLEAEVAGRGLDNVRFRDLVPRSQLAASLASARVHVIPQDPATAEFSVPSKVLSAMAVGRPVVTVAGPGSPLHDLSLACCGVTAVDPEDPDAFVEAVTARLADSALAAEEGAVCRAYIDARHRRTTRGRELVDLVLGRALGMRKTTREVAA